MQLIARTPFSPCLRASVQCIILRFSLSLRHRTPNRMDEALRRIRSVHPLPRHHPSGRAFASGPREAASPPRLVHKIFGADARVGLGRCTFRTDPRLVPIPAVAAFLPCRAAVHLTAPRHGAARVGRTHFCTIVVLAFCDYRQYAES